MAQLNYYVSVNEAIRAGRMNLRYIPLGFIIISSVTYAVFFFKKDLLFGDSDPGINFFRIFLIPLAGVAAAFLWRSFHTVTWKIWALENVKDAHRVYQIAVNNGMINKRDSWLNMFEYKSGDQRERLAALETRLDQPRQMEEPENFVSNGEREFPYSPKMALLQLGGFIVFLVLATRFMGMNFNGFFPMGVFGLIFAGFMLVRWVPRIGKPAPIRLNDTSLTIKSNEPVAWRDITNIYLESRQHGKNRVTYLVVETNQEPQKIELEMTDITGKNEETEQVLYDYWVKGKKSGK